MITDTFHGTVFSIKYQIPFATIVRESNQQKLTDLLTTFGLQDRQIKEISHLDDMFKKAIDQEMVREKIKEEQKRARQYLQLVFEGACD